MQVLYQRLRSSERRCLFISFSEKSEKKSLVLSILYPVAMYLLLIYRLPEPGRLGIDDELVRILGKWSSVSFSLPLYILHFLDRNDCPIHFAEQLRRDNLFYCLTRLVDVSPSWKQKRSRFCFLLNATSNSIKPMKRGLRSILSGLLLGAWTGSCLILMMLAFRFQ